MTNKNLNALVLELKSLEKMQEELSQEIESIKDTLKSELTTRNTEEVILENFKVTYKSIESRRFDSTAFKQAEPEMYEQYRVAKSTMRLTIR